MAQPDAIHIINPSAISGFVTRAPRWVLLFSSRIAEPLQI
jgi:hypothetical protein